METGRKPSALVAIGVSGSGKTTFAVERAARLGWEMVEGDRLQPSQNVEKLRRGEPLEDSDRAPWLDLIGARLQQAVASGRGVVVTCSALKRAYRARLLAARPDLVFVYLNASRALLEARVSGRHHEYMPATLLDSQLATLEPPGPDEPAIVIDAGLPTDAEVDAAVKKLALNGRGTT